MTKQEVIGKKYQLLIDREYVSEEPWGMQKYPAGTIFEVQDTDTRGLIDLVTHIDGKECRVRYQLGALSICKHIWKEVE